MGGGGRRCNVELLSPETRVSLQPEVGGTRGSMQDQFVTAVTEDGPARHPFEDLEIVIDMGCSGPGPGMVPRLLEAVLDLGMKTLRKDAVAPFLSDPPPLPIIMTEVEFVVVVVEAVILVGVVVEVVGVEGGLVEAEDLLRNRFIFIVFFPS